MGRSFHESPYGDRQQQRRDGEDRHLLHRQERRRDRQVLEGPDDDPRRSKRQNHGAEPGVQDD